MQQVTSTNWRPQAALCSCHAAQLDARFDPMFQPQNQLRLPIRILGSALRLLRCWTFDTHTNVQALAL